jgi:hypothetical protein
MSYNPEQPRDEKGMWTEWSAADAGRAADEASRQADERDEALGSASGYNRHHGEAAALYRKAAEAARGVVEQHLANGNVVAAARYQDQAQKHDKMAERHGAVAGSNEQYKAGQNATIIAEAKPHQGPSTNAKAAADKIRHAGNAVRASENDDEVRSNLEPHLRPLWERMKGDYNALKMTPEQREEGFRKYVHDHPRETSEALERHADQKLQKIVKERTGLGAWADRVTKGKVIKAPKSAGMNRWADAAVSDVPF